MPCGFAGGGVLRGGRGKSMTMIVRARWPGVMRKRIVSGEAARHSSSTMKNTILLSVVAATIFLVGCGKNKGADGVASPGATPAPATAPAAVTGPALAAWVKGDKAGAVDDFLAADWSAGPLFSAGSKLALTEEQFKALSDAEREGSQQEMSSTLNALRELAKAVEQSGRDAAAKGDTDRAGKCFAAVKACGTAMDKQENLVAVIRLGQSFQRDADRELRGLGK